MKHANENLPVPLEISDEALDQLLANAQVTAAEPFRKKRMKRDVSRLIKRTRTIRFGMDLRLAYSAVGVIAVGAGAILVRGAGQNGLVDVGYGDEIGALDARQGGRA